MGLGVSVAGGVNVWVGVSVIVRVNAIVAVSVTVGVYVMVGVNVFVGLSVAAPVGVAVGWEAIREDVAAPTDDTSWATINTEAMRAAATPREARDLLA